MGLLFSTYLELKRSLNHSTRRTWAWIYLVLSQIYVIYAFLSSLRLGNFLNEGELIEILSKLILYMHVFGLPSFILINCFDNFVQDPTLPIMAVAAPKRSELLFSRSIAIFVYTYSIFLINISISFAILGYLHPDVMVIQFYLKSLAGFAVVTVFYVMTITALIIVIRAITTDIVSTIFLPLALYYIIPFLISNALIFEVLDPIILKISPTIWVLDFIGMVIFNNKVDNDIFMVPIAAIISIVISLRAFGYNEFD